MSAGSRVALVMKLQQQKAAVSIDTTVKRGRRCSRLWATMFVC